MEILNREKWQRAFCEAFEIPESVYADFTDNQFLDEVFYKMKQSGNGKHLYSAVVEFTSTPYHTIFSVNLWSDDDIDLSAMSNIEKATFVADCLKQNDVTVASGGVHTSDAYGSITYIKYQTNGDKFLVWCLLGSTHTGVNVTYDRLKIVTPVALHKVF